MPPGPKPSVRCWGSRKAYGCWIGSDQHILAKGPNDAPNGPTYLAALDRFRKLVAQDEGKGTDDYRVSALLNQYRAHLRATRKSGVPGVFGHPDADKLHEKFLAFDKILSGGDARQTTL